MDWRTVLVLFSLAFYVDGFSKYGRTCRDIGCLNSEVCVLAEDPCSYGRTSNCGTYPTCKKKSQVEGSHSEPAAPSMPKPKPVPTHDDSPPHYPAPAPPGGSSFANSPYDSSNGGRSPYGGSSGTGGNSPYNPSPYNPSPQNPNPYGGSSPYGSHGGSNPYGGTGGSSPYDSNNRGGSPYGGSNPYGGSSHGGSNPYGGSSHGGSNPYGGSSHGGSTPFGGSSGGSGGTFDSILNTLNKYANGGRDSSHGSPGAPGGGSSGSSITNILGGILQDITKNQGSGGLSGLFNTRRIQENPYYHSANSRSPNSNYYPSGHNSQAPVQNRNYGQAYGQRNMGTTNKPVSYGWNVGVAMILSFWAYVWCRS